MILTIAFTCLVAGFSPVSELAPVDEDSTKLTTDDQLAAVRQVMVGKALEEAADEAERAFHMLEHSRHVIDQVDKFAHADSVESKEDSFEDILWDKDGETKPTPKSSGTSLKELRNLLQRHRNLTKALKHVDSATQAFEDASLLMNAVEQVDQEIIGEDEDEDPEADNVRKLTLLLGATTRISDALETVDIVEELIQEPPTEAPCEGERKTVEVKPEVAAIQSPEETKSAWA